ncbi:hypothetical protein V8C86DRAFT_3147572, partial [Haematococcus lacustris]
MHSYAMQTRITRFRSPASSPQAPVAARARLLTFSPLRISQQLFPVNDNIPLSAADLASPCPAHPPAAVRHAPVLHPLLPASHAAAAHPQGAAGHTAAAQPPAAAAGHAASHHSPAVAARGRGRGRGRPRPTAASGQHSV